MLRGSDPRLTGDSYAVRKWPKAYLEQLCCEEMAQAYLGQLCCEEVTQGLPGTVML